MLNSQPLGVYKHITAVADKMFYKLDESNTINFRKRKKTFWV